MSTTIGFDIPTFISEKEKLILRSLANEVADLSARDVEARKAYLWKKHNDLHGTRPLIFCDPENGWNEIINQDQIKCQSPLLRVWEMHLRKEVHWANSFRDDKVIEPFFNVPYHYTDTGYGLKEIVHSGGVGGAFKYEHPITDYKEQFSQLHYPEIIVDYKNTEKVLNLARELFDGILEVRLRGIWWWTLGLTWDFIKLRGMENLMLDMILFPKEVHQMMEFLKNALILKLDFLEKSGLLALNTGGTYVGSGGFGWTSQLPVERNGSEKVRTSVMWGFCESQETVGVSPEMFSEFVLPYQVPIMERFGLSCYGCCEPLDLRWNYLRKIKGLRRVSVSPWADTRVMAEYLGRDFVYSRKPSPTPLATSDPDWTAIRKDLREFIKISRDCHVEIIMKDNHTLGKNPKNASEWCKIAMEEAGGNYSL